MAQKYAAYDAQGAIVGFYDSVDSPVPAGLTNVIEISDAEWQACLSQQGEWNVLDGMLQHTPTPYTAVELDPSDDGIFGGQLWQF